MATAWHADPTIIALAAILGGIVAGSALLWYLVWIIAALILDWSRFRNVVREFITNARKLAQR